MKRKSSFLALVLVLLMMLSIVGCSKKAEVDAPAPPSEPTAATPAEPTTPTPAEPTTPATPTEPAPGTPADPAKPATTPTDPAKPAASTPTTPAKPAATTPTTPAKPAPSTPAPSTPAPSTPAPSTPAPSTPAPSTPAPSTPAGPTVPASLTGDKADAYTLLVDCKYDGNASGDLAATIYKVPILGDTNISVKTTSTANASKMTTDGVPGLVGGDVKDASFSAVPFSEIVSGNAANLEAFLKEASSVSVSGNTITVNSTATASFVTLLNKVSSKVTWTKANVKLTYTISVSSGKVSSVKISSTSAKCTANGSPYEAKVGGTVTY